MRGEAARVLKVRGGGQRTVRPTGDTEATRNAHYCGIRPEPFRPSLRSATSPERGGLRDVGDAAPYKARHKRKKHTTQVCLYKERNHR